LALTKTSGENVDYTNLTGKAKVDAVRELFAKSEGRWVSAVFIKRTDGTERAMTCRVGVKKYVKGVGLSFNPEKYALQVVWEPKAGKAEDAYRMVSLDGVISLKVDGTEYLFN
jgi:hypothetical protein